MNQSSWVIIGLFAVGVAVWLFWGEQTAAADASADTGGTGIQDSEGVIEMGTSGIHGKLGAAEIAVYAAQAGFTGDDLANAIAVALAESGGDPNIQNPEKKWFALHPNIPYTGDNGSFGLWQVFSQVHPEFVGQDLTDPQTNADAAFSVYQNAGMSFRPWSTYNTYSVDAAGKQHFVSAGTGPFTKHLAEATDAANGVQNA